MYGIHWLICLLRVISWNPHSSPVWNAGPKTMKCLTRMWHLSMFLNFRNQLVYLTLMRLYNQAKASDSGSSGFVHRVAPVFFWTWTNNHHIVDCVYIYYISKGNPVKHRSVYAHYPNKIVVVLMSNGMGGPGCRTPKHMAIPQPHNGMRPGSFGLGWAILNHQGHRGQPSTILWANKSGC